jgi:hypothetical protein
MYGTLPNSRDLLVSSPVLSRSFVEESQRVTLPIDSKTGNKSPEQGDKLTSLLPNIPSWSDETNQVDTHLRPEGSTRGIRRLYVPDCERSRDTSYQISVYGFDSEEGAATFIDDIRQNGEQDAATYIVKRGNFVFEANRTNGSQYQLRLLLARSNPLSPSYITTNNAI